jgi:hypothetical protein
MTDAETTIAAIFAAAKEDPECAAAADTLAELHAAGDWQGPAIVKILAEHGAANAD